MNVKMDASTKKSNDLDKNCRDESDSDYSGDETENNGRKNSVEGREARDTTG